MKKTLVLFFVGFLAAASGLVVSGVVENVSGSVNEANAARRVKVTICHRTNATTNPYRLITVSSNSFNRANGHTRHDNRNANDQYPPFDPTVTYPNNAKNWGDIIPGGDSDGTPFNGSNSFAQNWTAAGKAFMLANGANKALCRKMSAKDFFDIEKAAGTPEAEILEDLNDQGSSEDSALKEACGGSFSECSPSSWNSIVSATTKIPTDLTSDGGKINGEVKCGTGTATKWYFEYSTDPLFAAASVVQVPSTPGDVTSNPQANFHTLGGLAQGFYYYRVVCVTNYNTDDEGYLEGAIKVLGIGVPFITTTTLKDGVVGTPYTDVVESDGGTAPRVNYRLVPSAGRGLPPGLSLDADGNITGTPTEPGMYTIDVIVTDSAGTPVDSVSQELTIRVRKPQTVTIPDPSPKKVGDAPFPGNITSNVDADEDGVLGEFTSYTSSTPTICTISASGEITILAAGQCTITANHSGNKLWAPGTNTRSFTIEPTPSATTPALGRVIGEVWFDINKNNVREANEPLLPGLPVSLTPRATVSSKSAKGVVKSFASTLTTDSNGGFDFSSLEPGSYTISGNLPDSTGISKSWDSDGNTDWTVNVVVVANETKRGDLAGIGEAGFLGQVTNGPDGSPTPGAEVTALWAGFDKKIGTTDDVSFKTKANSKGQYSLNGVPIGKFAVEAIDPVTKAASRQSVTLTKAAINPANRPRITFAVVPKNLPATGGNNGWALQLSFALLGVGGIWMALPRLRRRVRRR